MYAVDYCLHILYVYFMFQDGCARVNLTFCPTLDCDFVPYKHVAYMENQLYMQMKGFIRKYYLVCSIINAGNINYVSTFCNTSQM